MQSEKKIPMTTQQVFKEYSIVKTIGIVKGNTIRARHLGKDILAGFKSMIGSEIEEYTKMMADAREQAIGPSQKNEYPHVNKEGNHDKRKGIVGGIPFVVFSWANWRS